MCNIHISSNYDKGRNVELYEIFFDVNMNKQLNKQSSCHWFEMSWHLWDAIVISICLIWLSTKPLPETMMTQFTYRHICITSAAGLGGHEIFIEYHQTKYYEKPIIHVHY